MTKSSLSSENDLHSRAQLLLAVRALVGASLQKLWLASPHLIALQLRTPGRTQIVAVDAQSALCYAADERPASPESALKAQATLRASLTGARFAALDEVFALDAPEQARQTALRLTFETPSGVRTLIADPRAHALALSAIDPNKGAHEKIIWAAPGAVAAHRAGNTVTPWRIAALPPPRDEEGRETTNELSRVVHARALADDAIAAQNAERFLQEKQQLARTLKTRLQKIVRTRQAVERDAAQAGRAIEARRFAELLLPHQSKIPRGAREAIVPDWSQLDDRGEPLLVTIALDPALGAGEIASRMLKKAHRYAAAQPRIAARQMEMARAERDLAQLLLRAEAAADLASVRALAAESRARPSSTRDQADRANAGAARPGAQAQRLPYRTFRTRGGARVLVGRSAKDNDTLTLRFARGDDLWLHVRGVQGSHVILVSPGEAPDSTALAEAALLATHFSSARGADGAEVSWTRRKYVRKGRGQAPGAVTFSQEKTLRVRLDEPLLLALLASEESG